MSKTTSMSGIVGYVPCIGSEPKTMFLGGHFVPLDQIERFCITGTERESEDTPFTFITSMTIHTRYGWTYLVEGEEARNLWLTLIGGVVFNSENAMLKP